MRKILCALVVVLVVVGLHDHLSAQEHGSKKEPMGMWFSKDILIVNATSKPKTAGVVYQIPALPKRNRLDDFRSYSGCVRGRDHVFRKRIERKSINRIEGVPREAKASADLFDNPRSLPVITKSVFNTNTIANNYITKSVMVTNEVVEPDQIVIEKHNEKSSSLPFYRSLGSGLGGGASYHASFRSFSGLDDSSPSGFQCLLYEPNTDTSNRHASQTNYPSDESPASHLLLRFKVLLLAPFLPLGIWIAWRSLAYSDWRDTRASYAVLGIAQLLFGAALSAVAFGLMLI